VLQKQHDLLEILCKQTLNRDLNDCLPVNYSPDDVLGFLWPMNELFRPRFHQIKTVSYRKQYERAADTAIENLVLKGAAWDTLPLTVWRVLLERHLQALIMCVANRAADNPVVMYAPVGLKPPALTTFSVVFWWYAMKLPYQVTDESALDIESPFAHLSGRLH